MIARYRRPAFPLAEFVEVIWYQESDQLPHARERLLPQSTVELVINLLEDRIEVFEGPDGYRLLRFRSGVICGPHSECFIIDTAAETRVIGVHFRPGGAFPFLGLPASELHNAHVGLETIWGALADEVWERLMEARGPEAKLSVLEQALLARANGCFERHPAVRYALKAFQDSPRPRTVGDVIDETGFSPRHFIELFRDEVGMTPKLFYRVQRFQDVVLHLKDARRVDWADIAVRCGYFDQAHFIRDFQAFSGLNPSAYLAQRGEHMNHVPILD